MLQYVRIIKFTCTLFLLLRRLLDLRIARSGMIHWEAGFEDILDTDIFSYWYNQPGGLAVMSTEATAYALLAIIEKEKLKQSRTYKLKYSGQLIKFAPDMLLYYISLFSIHCSHFKFFTFRILKFLNIFSQKN